MQKGLQTKEKRDMSRGQGKFTRKVGRKTEKLKIVYLGGVGGGCVWRPYFEGLMCDVLDETGGEKGLKSLSSLVVEQS